MTPSSERSARRLTVTVALFALTAACAPADEPTDDRIDDAAPAVGEDPRVLGAFTYMADAPGVVLCDSGIRYPVAMEGGYLDLERAYVARGGEPGAPWLVRLVGEVADRPAMEGAGTEESYVVSSFVPAPEGERCSALEVADAFATGSWIVVELDGDAVEGAELSIEWDPAEPRVAGYGGCNNFSGRGFLRGTELIVGDVVSTLRYCEGVMDTEGHFLRILEDGGRLRFDGDDLVLERDGMARARFRRGEG